MVFDVERKSGGIAVQLWINGVPECLEKLFGFGGDFNLKWRKCSAGVQQSVGVGGSYYGKLCRDRHARGGRQGIEGIVFFENGEIHIIQPAGER